MPKPLDQRVQEKVLPFLYSVLLENRVKSHNNLVLIFGKFLEFSIAKPTTIVHFRKNKEQKWVQWFLGHKVLWQLTILHHKPHVVFHLLEIPITFTCITKEFFYRITEDPK